MSPIDRLSKLPGELIEHICIHLSGPKDIHSLRLTCKALHNTSDRSFAAFHFRTVQAMITRGSLQALIDLAKDQRFGPVIKELQICLVTFPEKRKDEIHDEAFTEEEEQELRRIQEPIPVGNEVLEQAVIPANVFPQEFAIKQQVVAWKQALKKKRRRLYDQYMHEQNTMRTKRTDIDLLSEAVCSLPALESITLVDILDEHKLPLGFRKIEQDIGLRPKVAAMPDEKVVSTRPWDFGVVSHERAWMAHNPDAQMLYRRCCAHAIALVFGAVIRSGVQLKGSLTLAGVPWELALSATPMSRRLTATSTPARTFAESNLEELRTGLQGITSLTISTYHYAENDHPILVHATAPLDWLFKITPYMRALRSLTVAGARISPEMGFFRALARQAVFPELRSLELRCCAFKEEDVVRFLMNHASSLRRFAARDCRLMPTERYIDIINTTLVMDAMRSIDLLNEDYIYRHWRLPLSPIMQGKISHFCVDEATNRKFRTVLEAELIQFGEK